MSRARVAKAVGAARRRVVGAAADRPKGRPGLRGLVAVFALVVTACARPSARPPVVTGPPELLVRTVPAATPRHAIDEYLQLVVARVHVARPRQGSPWWSPQRYFAEPSTRTILTIGAQVNGQSVGVLPVAALETRSAAVVREVKENQPLAPPLRLQEGDQLTLQASLVEVSEENASRLMDVAQKLGGAASLPVSTAVPGGGVAVDLAGQLWQLARVAGRPQDLTIKREGGLDRPLWTVERIEIVPSGDRARFDAERDRLLDPAQPLRDDDPTFVSLGVVRRARLYDPDLVLVEPSPMRTKIAHFLDELREGTDTEKAKTCRRLRRFLRTSVGVTPADETAVVLAAMRETGYDPDRSRAHLDGCLRDDDVRAALRAGFRWGSCDASTPCRLGRMLAEAWFGRRSLVPFTSAPLAVYDRLFAAGEREDVDPGEFLELFRLEPGWEPPQTESDETAAFRAVVVRGGSARPARVRVSLAWDAGGEGPRIARVDLSDPDGAAPGASATLPGPAGAPVAPPPPPAAP